jgi:hypothetical protein
LNKLFEELDLDRVLAGGAKPVFVEKLEKVLDGFRARSREICARGTLAFRKIDDPFASELRSHEARSR